MSGQHHGPGGSRQTGRVWIGTLSSIANGFLCDVITTFRERHADGQIDATDEGTPEQASFVKKGRLDVVDVRVHIVPQWTWNKLWAERVVVAVPRHTPCAKDAIK